MTVNMTLLKPKATVKYKIVSRGIESANTYRYYLPTTILMLNDIKFNFKLAQKRR